MSASSGSMSMLTGSSYPGKASRPGIEQRFYRFGVRDSLVTDSAIYLPHEAIHAGCVVKVRRGVPEIELGNVPVQMLDTDVMVRPVDAPLELREVVLAHLRTETLFFHVLAVVVFHGVVTGHLLSNRVVVLGTVSVKGRLPENDVLCNRLAKCGACHIRHDAGTRLASVRVDDRQHRRLERAAPALQTFPTRVIPVPVLGIATDVCLVGHHVTDQLVRRSGPHRLANPVRHV